MNFRSLRLASNAIAASVDVVLAISIVDAVKIQYVKVEESLRMPKLLSYAVRMSQMLPTASVQMR